MEISQKFSVLLFYFLLLIDLSKCLICTTNAQCVHGWCEDNICTCNIGWGGSYCNETTRCIIKSNRQRCGKHGTCQPDSTQCACDPGWIGETCDINLCNGKGVYSIAIAGCYCIVGYTGQFCDQCASKPPEVMEDGTIVPNNKTYVCCATTGKSKNSKGNVKKSKAKAQSEGEPEGGTKGRSNYNIYSVDKSSLLTLLNTPKLRCVLPNTTNLDCACRRITQANIIKSNVETNSSIYIWDDVIEYYSGQFNTQQFQIFNMAQDYENLVDIESESSVSCDSNVVNTPGVIIFIAVISIGGLGIIVIAVWIIWYSYKMKAKESIKLSSKIGSRQKGQTHKDQNTPLIHHIQTSALFNKQN